MYSTCCLCGVALSPVPELSASPSVEPAPPPSQPDGEGEREGGKDREREGEREGERDGGREGEREGGCTRRCRRYSLVPYHATQCDVGVSLHSRTHPLLISTVMEYQQLSLFPPIYICPFLYK